MLFLLRNIRRKLISSDNKVLTYLLYAIGEIFLVVVGILIAVQIDDSNQQRKDSKMAKSLLTNLQVELELNLKTLKSDSIELSRATYAGLELMKAIGADKTLEPRTVDSLIFRLIATPTSSLSQGAALDLASTGKIDLIRNDTLRLALLSFGSVVEDFKELQRLNNELLNAFAVPYLYEHFAFARMDARFQRFAVDWPQGRFDSDLGHLFNDRKFESIIDDLIFRNLTQIRQISRISDDIRISLDLIKRELEN